MNVPIQLYPIREWQEKDGKRLLKSIRLYMGKVHIATVYPVDKERTLYTCHPMFNCIDVFTSGGKPLEDIKTEIECSLKEFMSRLQKPRKLKKVTQK